VSIYVQDLKLYKNINEVSPFAKFEICEYEIVRYRNMSKSHFMRTVWSNAHP